MPPQEPPPYFAFYPDRFAGDAAVESMSTKAVGAYMLLLCKAWKQKPAGSLPDDDATLARLARMSDMDWSSIRDEVAGAFRIKDGRWVCDWLTHEHRRVSGILRAKREGGRAGAEARWNTTLKPGSQNHRHTHGIPNAKQSRAEQSREELLPARQDAPDSVAVREGLPACLRRIGVGKPALPLLAACPTLTPAEVEAEWSAVQKRGASLSNPVGVLVAELCARHGVVLPQGRKLRPEDALANQALRKLRENRR